jgi:hypothetical protein
MKTKMNILKNLLVALSILISTQAMAMKMTPSELASHPKCSKEQCFKNDGGKSFLHDCEFQRTDIPPYITVLGPLFVNDQPCYCPCTLDYLAGAVRD